MWSRPQPARLQARRPQHRRPSLFCCALVVLAALSLAAPATLAREPLPGQARDALDAEEPLGALIRSGVRAWEKGDLAAADAVWARVHDLQPEHPAAAIFELKTLQARRLLDYWDGRYEQAIRERAEEALRLGRDWLEREPDAPQAHFYFGQALLEMMVIDGMARRYYKAGTQGEKARRHLERALALDPNFVDAKLPLGIYYYYGSIATRFIPFLRWLWFVPKGDRDVGVAYMEEVSHDGDLLRFEAASQLAGMYSYVEDRPDLAEPILIELSRRHPENSALRFELLVVRLQQQDYPGTVAAALALEQSQGEQFGDAARRDMARIWRARAELYRGRAAEADALVRSLEARFAELSAWIQRWLLVMRGQLHDVAGEREQAIASYSRVSREKPPFGVRPTAELARRGLDSPFELDAAYRIPAVSAPPESTAPPDPARPTGPAPRRGQLRDQGAKAPGRSSPRA
jgi:tetratricopeptide (TPR) repeat protein